MSVSGKQALAGPVEAAPKSEAGEARPEAEECVICFSEIEKKGSLKCSHSFCLECIRDWARRENTCPLCKARFTEIEVVDPAAAGRAHGKRKRPTTVKVKNRDQGDGYARPARNSRAIDTDADLRFGRLLAAMLEQPPAHIRRYFEVRPAPQARAPANAAILPHTRAPTRVPPATAAAQHGVRLPFRRPRPWLPVWDLSDEPDEKEEDSDIELNGIVPAGPTPTQAAARILQQRAPGVPQVVDLVDLVDEPDAPRAERREVPIVDFTASMAPLQPERQRPRLERPEHHGATQHWPRSSRTTVADIGATMQPMSPFAVATMAMSSLEAENRRAASHAHAPTNVIDFLAFSPEPMPWQRPVQSGPVVIDLTEPGLDEMERELIDFFNL